jgi:hypothetical protein
MDNATRAQILAAQYAGNSPDSIVGSFLVPGMAAAAFCIGFIIVVFVLIGIIDHFTEQPVQYYENHEVEKYLDKK